MEHLVYSPKRVIKILDNYASIDSGDFNQDNKRDYIKSKQDIFKSPFENAIIAKSDIDIAIDHLGRPGKWLCWCHDIEQSLVGDGLTPKQYKIAQYIQGGNIKIKRIARELSLIA